MRHIFLNSHLNAIKEADITLKILFTIHSIKTVAITNGICIEKMIHCLYTLMRIYF